jgi:hypothetical protein
VVPSVIALLESREARAREELDSWLEVLREAEVHADTARQRLDHARIAREEVLSALAAEGERPVAGGEAREEVATRPVVGPVSTVVVPGPAAVLPAGYDPRPPVWLDGMGAGVLSGVYRQVFEVVAAASGPVSAQELTRALGRDANRLNEVEKVRHRAYALQARGWLVRVPGGLFIPAADSAGGAGTRASAGAGVPSAS